MPGRTPQEAFSAFVDPLAEALKCIARTKIEHSPGGNVVSGKVHSLMLTGRGEDGYLPLDGQIMIGGRRGRLEMLARMMYKIVPDDRPEMGPWRCTTRAYDYSLRLTDKTLVLAYHWHPTGSSDVVTPHLHLGANQLRSDAILSHKHHVPTGRITLEAVIATAIQLGATPRYPDWEEILHMCEQPHLRYRSWNHDYESETGEKIL